jgi:ATP-binding cassette subfamily E protein 1
MVQLLAGKLKPDNGAEMPGLSVSIKPQTIAPKFQGTVRMLLLKRIKASFLHPQFNTDVLKPMLIESILDNEVQELSGGELQRVAITLCLGTPADIYLIVRSCSRIVRRSMRRQDEPSAYLDSEQRIITSRVIKRFILHAKKTAFVVEHDFIVGSLAFASEG